jgi:hypothetical protein
MKEWRAPPMPLAEAGCASSGGVPSLIGTGVVSDGARSWCSAYTAAMVGGIAGFLLSLFIQYVWPTLCACLHVCQSATQ